MVGVLAKLIGVGWLKRRDLMGIGWCLCLHQSRHIKPWRSARPDSPPCFACWHWSRMVSPQIGERSWSLVQTAVLAALQSLCYRNLATGWLLSPDVLPNLIISNTLEPLRGPVRAVFPGLAGHWEKNAGTGL